MDNSSIGTSQGSISSSSCRDFSSQHDVDTLSQELFNVMLQDEVVREVSEDISMRSRTKGPPKPRGRQTRRRRSTSSLSSGRRSTSAHSSGSSSVLMDNPTADASEVTQQRTGAQRNSRSNATYSSSAWICTQFNESNVLELYCGEMDSACDHCDAMMFEREKSKRCEPGAKEFGLCCHKGKVPRETMIFHYPEFLLDLLTNPKNPDYHHFHRNIRAYNSAISFASMGVKVAREEERPSGDYLLKLHGQLYHRTFHAKDSAAAKQYSQLYFIDPAEANAHRMQHGANAELREDLINLLDAHIRHNNSFARLYQSMRDKVAEYLNFTGQDDVPNLRIEFRRHPGVHPGRGNLPTSNDIAAVFDTPNGLPPKEIDFVVYLKAPEGRNNHENRSISIPRLSPNIEPMTFVLFYPDGGQGWTPSMTGNGRQGRNKRVTQLEYYCSKLVYRPSWFNPILYGGKLMQQYVLFAWFHTEANRLNWIRHNQTQLRVDSYQGLADYLNRRADEMGALPGSRVILPSTFEGSERHLRELYYDCMAIVGSIGRPDFFITFTCNPAWREIQENLFAGQKPCDRPMLVNRVFNMKLEEFLTDVVKRSVFGKVAAYIVSIEFQKRGLPHAHMLFIMENGYKITEPEDVDLFIRAEFPDPEEEAELHAIVQQSMLHGPCGADFPDAPCMAKGQCSKGYPKPYCDATYIGENGFPKYRRTSGYNITLMRKNKQVTYDNRHVVPYNPFCSRKYNCHINVEICGSMDSIKYVNKYILKGHDCTSIKVTEDNNGQRIANIDEIDNYCEGRFVSAPEAAYRLAAYPMHRKSHVVHRVGVHEEDLQRVYFQEGSIDRALARAQETTTQFQAWFELNSDSTLGPEARKYLYKEIPIHYVFKAGKWKPRTPNDRWKIVVRLYNVSPKDVDLFHLRLLTLYIRGARSFQELKSFEGVTYNTYREACIARGLLETDQEWEHCLNEGRSFSMPHQLRQTFAFICAFNNPGDAVSLWEMFKDYLAEDYLRFDVQEIGYAKALKDIEATLRVHGFSNSSFGLPVPADIADIEMAIDEAATLREAENMIGSFEPEQLQVFEAITEALERENREVPICIYIDGAGGTGKTFCLNAIIRYCRGKGKKVCSFASTGIAADLNDGGRTLHSGFRLPLDMQEGIRANATKTTAAGRRLIEADLIMIDEATMVNVHALQAISDSLSDLCDNMVPFGGKLIVLAGDWRQTLPIVERASKKVILENCITSNSALWSLFRRYTLKVNRRAAGHPEFCNWLLEVGEGRLQHGPELDVPDSLVEIPAHMVVDAANLMQHVYGESIQTMDPNYLAETVVITPLNVDSQDLNIQAMNMLSSPEHTYYSADSVVEPEIGQLYPPEFLYELKPSGMPPHVLRLKEGCVVMLMRNLQIERGLLNGTRMMVTHLRPNVVVCVVIRGNRQGQVVIVPRISMASNSRLPFTLMRRQFPLIPAYAMTINKSQGQSFTRVGLWLPRPVFSHGQLYVALSRTRDPNNLKISISQRFNQGDLFQCGRYFTPNIVWPEVYQQVNRFGTSNEDVVVTSDTNTTQRKRPARNIPDDPQGNMPPPKTPRGMTTHAQTQTQ